jgi:GTP diphosphokinase / guanosine-3',5'-bis(diphosphate) 3'-diphosphatase
MKSVNPPPKREDGMTLVLRAAAFAARKHRDQRRKDPQASPYINHPIALAELLSTVGGVEDPKILAAALLHDTVEDTQTTTRELEREFGREIASIVAEVTDDKRLPKQRRKELQVEHAAHLSRSAKLVKLADKICNVRDVRLNPPKDWPRQRRREYLDWAKRVVDEMRGTNSQLERRFDAHYSKRGASKKRPPSSS